MWIFDSYYKGTVELWGRENGPIKVSLPFPNSFYMHLRDPPAYREMLAALEEHLDELTTEMSDMSKDAECREERDLVKRYVEKLRDML